MSESNMFWRRPIFWACLLAALESAFYWENSRREAALINELIAQYHHSNDLRLKVGELCKLLGDKGLHLDETLCSELFNSVDKRGDGLDGRELDTVLHKVVDLPGLDPKLRKLVKSSEHPIETVVLALVLPVGVWLLGVWAERSIKDATDARIQEGRLMEDFVALSAKHNHAVKSLKGQIKAESGRGRGSSKKVAELEAELNKEHRAYNSKCQEFEKDYQHLEENLKKANRLLAFLGYVTGGRPRFQSAEDFGAGAQDGYAYEPAKDQARSIYMQQTSIKFGGYDPSVDQVVMFESMSQNFNAKESRGLLGEGKQGCFLCKELTPSSTKNARPKEWAVKRYTIKDGTPRADEVRAEVLRELRKYAMSKDNQDDQWLVKYERVFECHDYIFVLMENLKLGASKDLFDVLSAAERAPDLWRSRYLAIFTDIVRAVKYIHERQIFHNDLKLENVFVVGDWRYNCSTTHPDGYRTIKLIDFGMSTFQTVCPGRLPDDLYNPPETKSLTTDAVDQWRLGQTFMQMVFNLDYTDPHLAHHLPLIKDVKNFDPAKVPEYTELLKNAVTLTKPALIYDEYDDAPLQVRTILQNLFLYDTSKRWTAARVLQEVERPTATP